MGNKPFDENLDEFMENAAGALEDEMLAAFNEEDLAASTGQMLTEKAVELNEKVSSGFISSISHATAKFTGKFLQVFNSPVMRTHRDMLIKTSTMQAQQATAKIFLGVFWGYMDKLPLDKKGKMYYWLCKNPATRFAVVTSVCMATSSLLISQVPEFMARSENDKENGTKWELLAKSCLVLSEIMQIAILQEGGSTFNLTTLPEKIINVLVNGFQGNKDLQNLIDSVTPSELNQVIETTARVGDPNTAIFTKNHGGGKRNKRR